MGDMATGGSLSQRIGMTPGELDRARAGDAGRAVVRLAVLRAHVGVVREREPEHVHADRPRRRRRVRLQRGRDDRAGRVPRRLPHARRGRHLLRHDGRHHRARAARPGARAARAPPDGRGDPPAARPGAEDRAPRARRPRRGRAARVGAGGRPAARAARRKGSRSTAWWSTAAPAVDESMVTGESIPVDKRSGRPRDRRDDRVNGTFTMRAERVGSETLLAQIVRMVGRGAAHARADSAAGRSRGGVFRAGGRAVGGPDLRRVERTGGRSRVSPTRS